MTGEGLTSNNYRNVTKMSRDLRYLIAFCDINVTFWMYSCFGTYNYAFFEFVVRKNIQLQRNCIVTVSCEFAGSGFHPDLRYTRRNTRIKTAEQTVRGDRMENAGQEDGSFLGARHLRVLYQ